MECHDIRLLLAFAQRPSEQLDAVEREAIAQHLHTCPDCAALAQAERHVDELLGQVMRDVSEASSLMTASRRSGGCSVRPTGRNRLGIRK